MPPMNQQDSMHRDFSLPPVSPGVRDIPVAPVAPGDVVDPTNGNVIQEVPAAFPITAQP